MLGMLYLNSVLKLISMMLVEVYIRFMAQFNHEIWLSVTT